jgi:tetratricopeptide (TPR) repeat protein
MDKEMIISTNDERGTIMESESIINLPVKTANALAQTYLENISSEDLYEAEAALQDLSALVQRIINQEIKSGDADDWHNFAVDVARKDLYDLACDLIECGLTIYPKNIDLLADYLQYGTSCGRAEKCKTIYKSLSKIPMIRWGWRGYSFSVSYLTYLWERSDSEKELEKLQDEMLYLASCFRKNLPYDEESYRCEADIYKLLHMKKEEEDVLRLALNNLKIAPKCALRLSDLLFDRGDYEEALLQIQRGLRDAMQTQRSINEGYLYYLMGLTKMALAQQANTPITEETAYEIYADFDISLQQEHRSAYVNNMKTKTIVLMSKTGVRVPDRFEELCYLVQ